MERKMFYKADNTIFHNARELRNHPTEAERILWMHLRSRPQGYKFRRQHPVANYILDFYCHPLKLAIEVDGPIHNEPTTIREDIERQKNLGALGIIFIRFTNEEILLHMDIVITKINVAIDCYNQNSSFNISTNESR